MAQQKRCSWAESSDAMRRYHDDEWGKPSHDERHLFEMLILEGAQAGLSWSTILNKRSNYRAAFADFDPEIVAQFDEAKVLALLEDPGIVRNRLKVRGTVTNAQAFLAVTHAEGSFGAYLWRWVEDTPIVRRPRSMAELPASDDLSDRLSKDLKKRGFTFVGTTIIYSYLQSVGLIDDHLIGCPAKTPSPARRRK
jgi:DNA-3-methyladenine glycosylase I